MEEDSKGTTLGNVIRIDDERVREHLGYVPLKPTNQATSTPKAIPDAAHNEAKAEQAKSQDSVDGHVQVGKPLRKRLI
jgi:hypothetical protein